MERTAKGIINSLIVLSAVALTFSSCERMAMMAGTPVKFNAGISRHGTSETKAVYGSAGATATSQPIEWEKDDLITVYCEQCEDTNVADYVVAEVHPSGSESNSYAKIGNASGNGLIWGDEGTHTFYALFPGVNTTGVTASINGKDITGSIPQSQAFGTVTGTDDKVVPPVMKNMFMTAKSEIEAGEAGEPVFLDFMPLTTALEFTITNQFDDTESAMNIKSISLISDGHALSGGFAVDMDETGLYGRPKTTLGSGVVTADCDSVAINFGSSPVSLAYGKTLNFHFFLNPGNATAVDDLTFEIKGVNAGTSEPFTRRAKLEKKDKSKVTFPTHQKTRISGIMVPESIAWTINYDPTVEQWNKENESIDLENEVNDALTFVISWEINSTVEDLPLK